MKYLYYGVLVTMLAGWPPLSYADKMDAKQADASSYLEIYKEFNGRCQGLRRGDIRMIRNTHPDKAIEFRMIRLLAGHRQASLIQDTINPDDEGQKLGCEKLDELEQTWEVVRARFVEPELKAK